MRGVWRIDAAAKNALGPDGLSPLIERCLPGSVQIGVALVLWRRSMCERQIIAPMAPGLLHACAS